MKLSELKTGESAVIAKVYGHGGFRKRIVEMGFIKGTEVQVVLNAPLQDPVKYKVMDYESASCRGKSGGSGNAGRGGGMAQEPTSYSRHRG